MTANHPPKLQTPLSGEEADVISRHSDFNDVAALVEAIEPDGRPVPVMVRQYLKWGAQFLAFNEDKDFNSTDACIYVDLKRTNPALMIRYFGMEGGN